MTNVINLKHTVYIGRRNPLRAEDGYFGNPYILGQDGDRQQVLELYRIHFNERIKNDVEFKKRIEALKDKILLCYCKPEACHGDIIKEYLDQQTINWDHER